MKSELMAKKLDPKPPHYEHRSLGRFTLNRKTGDYVQQRKTAGRGFDLVLECGYEKPQDAVSCPALCAAIAERCLVTPAKFIKRGSEFAARRLTPVINAGRRYDGQAPITKAALLRQLLLSEITFNRSGGALWFEGGELLVGHVVIVSFGPRGGFTEAGLAG